MSKNKKKKKMRKLFGQEILCPFCRRKDPNTKNYVVVEAERMIVNDFPLRWDTHQLYMEINEAKLHSTTLKHRLRCSSRTCGMNIMFAGGHEALNETVLKIINAMIPEPLVPKVHQSSKNNDVVITTSKKKKEKEHRIPVLVRRYDG